MYGSVYKWVICYLLVVAVEMHAAAAVGMAEMCLYLCVSAHLFSTFSVYLKSIRSVVTCIRAGLNQNDCLKSATALVLVVPVHAWIKEEGGVYNLCYDASSLNNN